VRPDRPYEPTVITIKPSWISFGGTAAIVTSMGLILGLDAAASSTQSITGVLLIVALADNLSDSLSVHVYQEAERLESREAFRSTLANFVTRLLVALSFVVLVITLPRDSLVAVTLAWGFLLLALLTFRIARARGARVGKEIAKHVVIAAIVIVTSRWLGTWIAGSFG
jgi:VIT1/CCC1 family predicted Fe2+/Mn2+ transporter